MNLALLTRTGVAATLGAHMLALGLSGANAAATPISQLSRSEGAWIHTLGLLTLAAVWALLAPALWRVSHRALWRGGCLLLALSAPILAYVAFYFVTASDGQLFGPDANDPLAVLASTLGIAMGAFQSELRRRNAKLAGGNLLVLIAWIALVPVIPFIEPGWLGAYERCVGVLMLLWTALISYAVQPR